MKLDDLRAVLNEVLAGTEFASCTYFAGGCVRGFLLGMESSDFDLCVELQDGGIRCAKYLHSIGLSSEPTIFPRYGTAMVSFNQARLEFVPTLKVIGRSAGSKVRHTTGSLQDDVLRRDFSINSLVLRVNDGELLDLTGVGLEDLHQRLIRCTDIPEKIFGDDPVRLLRAIRFACELAFSIEQETWSELCRQSTKIASSAWERIAAEWRKIFLSPNPALGCRLLAASGMQPLVFPELEMAMPSKDLVGKDASRSAALLAAVQYTPADPVLRWTVLLHGIICLAHPDKAMDWNFLRGQQKMTSGVFASEILDRFQISGVFQKSILSLLHSILTLDVRRAEGTLADAELREILDQGGQDANSLCALLDAYDQAEVKLGNPPPYGADLKRRLLGQQKNLGENPFTLTGYNIMADLDVAKGPEVGELLKVARKIWLQHPEISHSQLLDELQHRWSDMEEGMDTTNNSHHQRR